MRAEVGFFEMAGGRRPAFPPSAPELRGENITAKTETSDSYILIDAWKDTLGCLVERDGSDFRATTEYY